MGSKEGLQYPSSPQDLHIADTADKIEANPYNPAVLGPLFEDYTQSLVKRDGIDSVPAGALPENNPYLREFQATGDVLTQTEEPRLAALPDPIEPENGGETLYDLTVGPTKISRSHTRSPLGRYGQDMEKRARSGR